MASSHGWLSSPCSACFADMGVAASATVGRNRPKVGGLPWFNCVARVEGCGGTLGDICCDDDTLDDSGSMRGAFADACG